MCGISGVFSVEPRSFEIEVQLMNGAMKHRGPDDLGLWSTDFVTLGHQRLSIIDLSDSGHQPMHSSDAGLTLVFNGEIYNFEELKKELEYPFQSQTDTEVILAAWQKWGLDCLDRFNGMFAFAVWDHVKKQLTVVRDRLGIKPLYYYFDGERLIFSSEMRSLLASGLVERKLCTKGLADYLRYQTVQAPNTIIENVWMLEPGSYLQCTAGGSRLVKARWWEIDATLQPFGGERQELLQVIKEQFYTSVKRRLVADVPFGAFLSGGIDSSAVVGAMAEVSGNQINTFNVSFAEEAFSEAKYASYIAQQHETAHVEIRLHPEDLLKDLPLILNAFDHPSGDGVNTYIVSRAIKEAGVTMALSGLGGDELFGGYSIFKRMDWLDRHRAIWKLPLSIRKVAGEVCHKLKRNIATAKVRDLLGQPEYDFISQYALSRQVLLDGQIKGLLEGELMGAHLPVDYLKSLQLNDKSLLSRVSIAEISTYMQNVLLRDTDQMSMAHALEVRVPFLDHELVELLLSVPDDLKYPHSPKQLLVDALPNLLPDYIVNRLKMGFVFPWGDWLKNELYELANYYIEKLADRSYFNSAELRSLWAAFNRNDPEVSYSRIWSLVVLGHWLEANEVN
jgi:asparagine synthase (glutamine-hydrolysing)